MPCNCKIAKKLTTGCNSLEIGTISSTSTAVLIYVQNDSTGTTYVQSATSSGAGVVTLDTTKPSLGWYHPNTTYTIWITLASAYNRDVTEDITVGGSAYSCFVVQFERQIGDDEQFDNITSQKITV